MCYILDRIGDRMKFKIVQDNKEIECEIVFTFKDDNNNISYIVYTDGTKDEDGELEIYASRYSLEGNQYILSDIENDYEWNLIDSMLDAKYKEIGEEDEKI